MTQHLLAFFEHFPPVIAIIFMAMLPLVERFALPVAVAGFHLPVWEAFFVVVLGNMVPVLVILTIADKFHAWLSGRAGIFGAAWAKAIEHAQQKFARYEKFGLIGLFLFLIIPTPVNGAFSASLIAFVLGYPRRRSLPYLCAGIVVGNIVALAVTLGALNVF